MKKLYVGNLSYQASEADLQSLFTQAGVPVDSVTIMRDRFSGDPRGFGFVEVADADLDRAVESVNGKTMMGRNLVVNEARPMRNSASAGAGRPRREY